MITVYVVVLFVLCGVCFFFSVVVGVVLSCIRLLAGFRLVGRSRGGCGCRFGLLIGRWWGEVWILFRVIRWWSLMGRRGIGRWRM